MKLQLLLHRTSLFFVSVGLSALSVLAQASGVPALVKLPVDLNNLVTLHGNIHPLARPEYDQGMAPDDLPMERVLLVLQRGADHEASLRQMLDDQQVKASARYHQWLTPEQFGQQFGPADSDLQAVTGWLSSQGFQVTNVSAGRTVIEFCGSAGLLRQVLGTEIHKFRVNGKDYWANTNDPQIPAALAPVVAGFASLNNFPRKPAKRPLDAYSRSQATGEVHALFTVTGSGSTYYAVGPTDFATIYNVSPLWNAGMDGTGQTIAVVSDSNIDPFDVDDFRSLFGLPFNYPQVILDGPDPGINDDEVEADIDVEWAGAVAKGATIDLVVAQATETTAGIDLSALYIIDNNLAPVMTESYGVCEQFLGAGGNAFYYATREQGAAQGITIINSSGDSGSARCDQSNSEVAAQDGLAVSGLASTPFNVAVGGTDFGDVGNFSQYWNATNNSSTLASAKSYIPETTWNNSCAASGQTGGCASAASDTPVGIDHLAAGGGPSNCGLWNGTDSNATCAGGYPKPAWQTGPGVPQDGVRDIPDVSLFASSGAHNSFYVLCQQSGLPAGYSSCNEGAQSYFLAAGGTSVAAPNFAGIMALVNQKAGERQGNANYVLYPLAAQSGATCTSNAAAVNNANCIFYDVVSGNNSVACVAGSKNCSNQSASGYGILVSANGSAPAWSAGTRYDVATGLGSVNAANLVNKWTTVSFQPTTTTLSSFPASITHGQAVSYTVSVTSTSGTPTGDVSLIAQNGSTPGTGIGTFTLGSAGSFSGTTDMLPGGSYNVVAHYAGDGIHGASDSTPQPVAVAKVNSQSKVAMISCNYSSGVCTSGATAFVYGSSLEVLRMDVTDASGNSCVSPATGLPFYPCPTGNVNPLVNGGLPGDLNTPYNFTDGSYALNGQGFTEDQYIHLPAGTDNLIAAYVGDNSYNPSTSPSIPITVAKASTTITVSSPYSNVTEDFPLTATIGTQSHGFAPLGTVQFLSDGNPIGQPISVRGINFSSITGAFATASANLLSAIVPVGTHSITAQYFGDGNYTGSTSAPITLTVTDFSFTGNPPSITLSNTAPTASTTLTITPLGGLTGIVTVDITNNPYGMTCNYSPAYVTLTNSSPATVTFSCSLTATVTSNTAKISPRFPLRFPPVVAWPWLFISGLLLVVLAYQSRWRRHWEYWMLAAALLIVVVWAACGGGGGGGAGSNPPGSPSVSLSSTTLTFPQESFGSNGPLQTVTVSNTGNATLTISRIAMGGTNPSDFNELSNCAPVSTGSTCSINVGFSPTAPGSRSASMAITDNASDSPQSVSLTGTGAPGPLVSLSPQSVNFGAKAIGSASAPQMVTLSNVGSGALTNASVSVTGDGFSQTNTCTNSIAPGLSCPISITFAPFQTGAQNGQLMVSYSGYSSPQSVGLTGKGGIAPGNYSAGVGAGVSGGGVHHSLQITIIVQ